MTASAQVRAGMSDGVLMAEKLGMTVPPLQGKLLRPLTAFSFVSPERVQSLDIKFWLGCLAIQMVHEASIHHDDVLDGGQQRRSGATLLVEKGVNASLLTGDLYLTSAYRIAAMTGIHEFLIEFIDAVEKMVRGEKLQGSSVTTNDLLGQYKKIVRMKSGELFGLSAALPGWHSASELVPAQLHKVGLELGVFYQMVDDFLDYCPASNTGKPKLQDFNNRIWTFVLGSNGIDWFDQSPKDALQVFFDASRKPSMIEEAFAQIEQHGHSLLNQIRDAGAQPPLIQIVEDWIRSCTHASQESSDIRSSIPTSAPRPSIPSLSETRTRIALRAQQLGPVSEWINFFAKNSLSFSFASRYFPAEERAMITEIYLFCRFTDNLVDKDNEQLHQAYKTLDLWDEITRAAYHGENTGITVADVVMSRMASMEIPYSLVSELIEGMRMDVEPRMYHSMDDLRSYTHRVASVVGAWMTQAFGIRTPWVLERAHDLGHAMQLTNIIRDVGEDLAMGRIYLPADLMASRNVTIDLLHHINHNIDNQECIPSEYIALIEDIMAEAESAYERAYEGIPSLPARLRKAIAVAAQVYRGIHEEVRANGFNNFTLRAYTSPWKKTVLARQGLKQLKRVTETILQ